MSSRDARVKALSAALRERIVILDGSMGTMIQSHRLGEADYRGTRFADHRQEVKGNNELLNLTRPDVIEGIHTGCLEQGADIIETNTLNATAISQAEYGMQDLAYELNLMAAAIARRATDRQTRQTSNRLRCVAGVLGPTNKMASMSPDVNNPGFRSVTFDELRAAYTHAAKGLLDGGADLFLVETVFDTNCKAALFALEELFEDLGYSLPVMVSGTVADLSGRNLSGQTMEAFWNAVRHARPLTIGLNCSLGAAQMRPHVAELSRVADTYICAYPNAGLPNQFGAYDEAPDVTAAHIRDWAQSGLVNVVGGCCGTTPEHIGALARVVAGIPPRRIPEVPRALRLSGLEPFELAS